MKITCPYCGNLFNDTLENCPGCGAPNSGVVRKSGKQPLTIEELKQWYESKGLPPYKTTRFFIGEDYRRPRAFGIYQDTETGNFVVYKNKDNGERAVRYEGTDEAYAVNELYQRLKQEILQQKGANVKKARSRRIPRISIRLGRFFSLKDKILIGFLALVMCISVISDDTPKDGYYGYRQDTYYHLAHQQPEGYTDWFRYDTYTGAWVGPIADSELPETLVKNTQAKAYYLTKETPSSMLQNSFIGTDLYRDAKRDYTIETGYYQYDDTTYYHLSDSKYSNWYYYDDIINVWYETVPEELPPEFQLNSTAEDFYFTPAWDSSTQITDFTDSAVYDDYKDAKRRDNASSDSWDDDDSDYSWDSGDSWDSGSTDWDSDW